MAELRWGASTDPGLVREANEDAFFAEPLVFGVADGMGGHQAGEVASALASNLLRDRLSAGAASIDVVVAAVLEANGAIFRAAHGNAMQQGMGTTVTALVVMPATSDEPESLALVNVGDSRTYLYRDGELTRATVDHSYVQELVATGHITEAEARTHPRRNIVTRALGIEPTVRVDSWVLQLVRGDRYILCSDGLVDEVPDHEIADVADGIADPQAAADELVAMAKRHGGRDNVTVLVVDVLAGLEPEAAGATHAPSIELSPTDDTLRLAAVAGDDTLRRQAPADNDTVRVTTARADDGAATRSPRRLTGKLFLLLLGVAAVLTVAITLIAVAVTDDDAPSPTTPATTGPATTRPATSPPSTTATSTSAPDSTAPDSTTRPTSTPTTSTPATSPPTTSTPTTATPTTVTATAATTTP